MPCKQAYTLLKPKRHSAPLSCLAGSRELMRMRNNIVYFRVMQRLYRREWNWLWNWRCVNLHPWQRTHDHGVWRLTLTAYCLPDYHSHLDSAWFTVNTLHQNPLPKHLHKDTHHSNNSSLWLGNLHAYFYFILFVIIIFLHTISVIAAKCIKKPKLQSIYIPK